ncbi:expressed unknown protein [Seminavis robusta]|uniref:O-fucosyltransferase family protein n=1 Tax=Seminavis robusta TaxID=568900 RepID=A0A9N8HH15_9STRA|nr:expressed unknown protein [Seminavis robusta]|eukprot:Sro675_g185430.1 n/a (581) ;mRNA; r:2088-3830
MDNSATIINSHANGWIRRVRSAFCVVTVILGFALFLSDYETITLYRYPRATAEGGDANTITKNPIDSTTSNATASIDIDLNSGTGSVSTSREAQATDIGVNFQAENKALVTDDSNKEGTPKSTDASTTATTTAASPHGPTTIGNAPAKKTSRAVPLSKVLKRSVAPASKPTKGPTVAPSSPPTPVPTKAPSTSSGKSTTKSQQVTQDQEQPRYLIHASHGGWSNQVRCIRHAYYMAAATGRILVTAPVLPHITPIGAQLWAPPGRFLGHGVISGDFNLKFALHKAYLKRWQPYLDMATVLDLKFTFPHVQTMDYRKFREQYYDTRGQPKTNLTANSWVMEDTYTHANTRWIREDLEPNITHGAPVPGAKHTYYRDLPTLAEGRKAHSVWTMLDTFYGQFLPSAYNHELSWMRFSNPIRQTAKTIHEQEWDDIPYASIHLRVGDDRFLRQANATIQEVLKETYVQMQQWIDRRKSKKKTIPATIGFFVATDASPEGQQDFAERLQRQLAPLLPDIRVFFASSYAAYVTKQLKQELVYPEIFLDQQLAACATIRFIASKKSTFSQLIHAIRRSPSACGAVNQ